MVRADSSYTDLSPTQYALALEWLEDVSLVESVSGRLELAPELQGLNDADLHGALFARTLERVAPPWLADADVLVRDASEVPSDASSVAQLMGISESGAFAIVQQIHGRIDLEQRARIGAQGELKLIALLESKWPGCTRHVALESDGLGYDVEFSLHGLTWHIEVKSTTRRGRLVVYLSRHEYEVGRVDPAWRLVVVGLDAETEAACLGTVDRRSLEARAPHDVSGGARWEAARYELSATEIQGGLHFLESAHECRDSPLLHAGTAIMPSIFDWFRPV